MAGPGRNDPCPCGSGKKFKHCCLNRPQTATGITPRDRTSAFEALLKYSRREEFDAVVAESARDWADMPLASAQEALQAILEFQTSTEAFHARAGAAGRGPWTPDAASGRTHGLRS